MIVRLGARIVAVFGLAGCGAGEVVLIAPPPPPASDVTLRLVPDADDVGLAQAIGWAGGVPGAQVVVTPVDSSSTPRTVVSESDGLVRLPGLARGQYHLEARRLLSPAERSRAGGGAVAWLARETRMLEAAATPALVGVFASRRGDLVVSEWSFNAAFPAGQAAYDYHSYVELYNQSDSTIYLDGMVLGRGFVQGYDYPTFPCADVASFAQDAEGVWSAWFQRFPGRGRDYPVSPGRAVLVATDAVDHRPFGGPDTPDLTGADFEFTGVTDVDNPAVPNMEDIGTRASTLHGIVWIPLWSAVFVARPIPLTDLPKGRPQNVTVDYLRFPRSHLLDVVSYFSSWTGSGLPACRLMSAALDRSPATGMGEDERADVPYSLQRIRLESGPVVLQDTRNSGIDFVRAIRTPGRP